MPAITSSKSEAHSLEVAIPEQANHCGTLCGPDALRMMGTAAAVCATRHACCAVVMAKADSIEFNTPIGVDAIVEIRAKIVFQGRSSMTVIVEILPALPAAREGPPSISGRFMMVAVDGDGVPIPIPVSAQRLPEEVCP